MKKYTIEELINKQLQKEELPTAIINYEDIKSKSKMSDSFSDFCGYYISKVVDNHVIMALSGTDYYKIAIPELIRIGILEEQNQEFNIWN